MLKNPTPLSYEVLCAEYTAVYRYALTLCASPADAQDLVQETFLRAMSTTAKFEGRSGLYTWLCAIAKNLYFNQRKRAAREVPPPEAGLPDPSPSLEDRIAEKDQSLRIHRILHTLKDPYKEVFSLRVFGELPFADVAALFGRTESWARVTYHRAKKQIIETIRKEDQDEPPPL